jgi:hypothetical protein
MGLPGFTADFASYRSPQQHRASPSRVVSAPHIVPQMSDGVCLDRECLSYCEERNPWDAARCYEVCQIPCNPYEPPEMLPPG